jgi:hypothetical protein
MLEVVVAGSILVVAVMGAMRNHISSQRLLQQSSETELAVETLSSTMAMLLEQPRNELADPSGAFGPNRALGGQPVFQDQNLQYTTPGYQAGDPVPEILTLRLTLTWTTALGETRTLSLVNGQS